MGKAKPKILYAANKTTNSAIQLQRIAQQLEPDYTLKIAAFQKYVPTLLNVDWSLDCLTTTQYINKLFLNAVEGDNFGIYYDQIKSFNPNLIITDLEQHTSYIALDLDIPLWQCASRNLQYGIAHNKDRYNLKKCYEKHITQFAIIDQSILTNSHINFIYSHYGDVDNPPPLKENYQWVRPYHKVGQPYTLCHHTLVAALPYLDKTLLSLLQKYIADGVIFTSSTYLLDKYQNFTIKSLEEQQEYTCNVFNSDIFFCRGEASLLADAYYNGKQALIYPNYQDAECLINSLIAPKLKSAKRLSKFDKIRLSPKIIPHYNSEVLFLHQHLKQFF